MYENLSDKELLSNLIMERQGEAVVEKLFQEFSALPYLMVDATIDELQKIKGIGIRRASQIKACLELAKRLYVKNEIQGSTIKSPSDIVALLDADMRYLRNEQFKTAILNTKNRIIEVKLISEGSLTASIVHPREVFLPAIKRSAAGLILIHNHPSGDAEPSSEDIETTKRLVESGNILGIKVLDHIILGFGRYVSLRERGVF